MRTAFLFVTLLLIAFIGVNAQDKRCSNSYLDTKSIPSDSLDVLHYNINLDISFLSNHSIKGYTELTIVPLYNSMNQISLDLLHLNVDSVFIGSSSIQNWQYNDTLIQIPLLSNINIGDTVFCKMYYHGSPVVDPSGWGGFYFSSDTTFAFNMGVGMQDNPHNYGRVWFPCVDNFTDRATYEFSITVKNSNTAICNGTLISTQQHNGKTLYHWNLQNDIPTYLASVAVGPYVSLMDTFHSVSGADIPIAIYVPQNKSAAAQGSFIHLKSILTAFEMYYGAYRWERVGYVGIPFGSGAMEHVTSIHIGSAYINGSTTYETLIAHELSHHWFGDLVTCHSAPDMWLNEGWAVFSESTYQEYVYGKQAYKNNMRNNLFDVLKNTHHSDNGYRAVAGVPHEYTYGSTVYDKGATVAHSLRGYLGDSLFFSTIRAYLSQKAFSDQSSIQFRDFISSYSGIDVSDFFDAWVFSPGFSQFTADSFMVNSSAGIYNVNVAARQRLNNKPNFANSNRMPITFMDDQWHRKDTILLFSGQNGSEVFPLSFIPTVVFTDLDEKFADATTDYSVVLKQNGLLDFQKSYFKLNVNNVADSALFQITHNWAGPDSMGVDYAGLHISSKHYWTVASNRKNSFSAQGQFRYWRTTDLDADIISSSQDSLVILYRPHGGLPWRKTNFQKQGNWITGYILVDNIQNGEYVLASYKSQYLPNSITDDLDDIEMKISPNPGYDNFRFEVKSKTSKLSRDAAIIIYNTQGQQIDSLNLFYSKKESTINWSPKQLPSGNYIAILVNGYGNQLISRKFIISK
jgi:aminopeptidase N